jgi:Zn-dependent protease with chaperone function
MRLPKGVRRERIEPLWERVDRNRAKFVLLIVGYLLSIAASAALFAGVTAALAGLLFLGVPGAFAVYLSRIVLVVTWAAGVSLVVGSAWVVYALSTSEKRLAGHIGAILTPTGSYTPTKLALKDMALAAGFEHAPPLWVIPGCGQVNAFAVGRTHRGAIMGITQGFADELSEDDQRAVFANLMARLTNGDVRWATAVSALVGPIWAMREADLRRGDEYPLPGENEGVDVSVAAPLALGVGAGNAVLGGFFYFVLYAFVIVLTELLMAGHQRSTMLTAEKADAEGMLLLKDPHDMLGALEKVLEADNTVHSAGEAHSALFYCWAGFGYAPEDDPEFQRLARLREVLGVEGLVDRTRIPMPAHPEELLSPPAPRLDAEGRPRASGRD